VLSVLVGTAVGQGSPEFTSALSVTIGS